MRCKWSNLSITLRRLIFEKCRGGAVDTEVPARLQGVAAPRLGDHKCIAPVPKASSGETFTFSPSSSFSRGVIVINTLWLPDSSAKSPLFSI